MGHTIWNDEFFPLRAVSAACHLVMYDLESLASEYKQVLFIARVANTGRFSWHIHPAAPGGKEGMNLPRTSVILSCHPSVKNCTATTSAEKHSIVRICWSQAVTSDSLDNALKSKRPRSNSRCPCRDNFRSAAINSGAMRNLQSHLRNC